MYDEFNNYYIISIRKMPMGGFLTYLLDNYWIHQPPTGSLDNMMAKRFTDTDKWDDPWFCDLPADMKLIWLYILDKCNHAGIYKVNFKLMKYNCHSKRSNDEIKEFLKDRFYPFSNEKWFIPKFVKFQYPKGLDSNKPAVVSVKTLLDNYGLLPIYRESLHNHCTIINESLTNDCLIIKDKDKDKDLTIDHIIPIKKGGGHDYENLQILCKSCNSRKGIKDNETFMGRTQ